MGIVSRATLKSYFERGDQPTEAQFVDLIDSFLSKDSEGFLGTKVNVADMLTVNTVQIEDNSHINILGFYSEGDDGGGMFYWDATESQSNHNGGTIIDPNHSVTPGNSGWWSSENTGSGCWVRAFSDNVQGKQYGIRANGSTDDTEAISALLNNHSLVTLPEGTMRVSTKITVTTETDIKGQGADKTKFKPDEALSAEFLEFTSNDSNNRLTYTRVKDFGIDATNKPSPITEGWGKILFTYVDNIEFANIYHGGGHGVVLCKGCDNINIDNIIATGLEEGFVAFVPSPICKNINISNLIGIDVTEGVDLADCENVNITNLVIDASNTTGDEIIDCGSSRNVNISNVIGFGAGAGIRIKAEDVFSGGTCEDITVSNVSFVGFNSFGIAIANFDGVSTPSMVDFTLSNVVLTSTVTGSTGILLQGSVVGGSRETKRVDIRNAQIDVDGRALDSITTDYVTISGGSYYGGTGVYIRQSSNIKISDIRTKSTSSDDSGGVDIDSTNEVTLQSVTVESSSVSGMKIKNTSNVKVNSCRVDTASIYGIWIEYTDSSYLINTDTMNAKLFGNNIFNWGSGSAFRGGVYVNENISGFSGSIKGVTFTNNTFKIDSANDQRAYQFNITNATEIDYVIRRDNFVINVPTEIVGAPDLGTNTIDTDFVY